jgi:surface protein
MVHLSILTVFLLHFTIKQSANETLQHNRMFSANTRLTTLDISGFNFRTVPEDEFQATLVESEKTSEELFVEQWNGEEVKATSFFIAYQNYCIDNKLPHCQNIQSLGMRLLKMIRSGKLLKKKTEGGFTYQKRP